MIVHYDITALPRRDFGEIYGEIIHISTDIISQEGLMGFFLIESEIENRTYYDAHGNGVILRAGMTFEARIIIKQQSVLFYLFDRFN